MMQPLLKVSNLSKNYGSTTAVEDASFALGKGEQLVILGASGSGKSSLLRCINYLEKPSRGTIWLDGQTIGGHHDPEGTWSPDTEAELVRKRRDIGMVFQNFNLFAHLSALDNIAIGPRKVLKRPKSECRSLARALLQKVHLDRHADQYPSQLSGGEQQRVAIARALAMNPKLLLFDEPTSALDPRLTHEVLQVMQELATEGIAMIVVTHEIGFARKIARTVMYLEKGRIVETGPVSDFFARPEREQTRQFLSYVM
ncbi:MAG: amino acid ABC transporter ATP-binding protein [Cyanobacteria bacterium P01_F01_bin.33]